MKPTDKNTIAKTYILLFISPPLAILSSFKNMKINHRRWLLIIAGTLLGGTFLFDEIGDGIRHYEMVETFYSDMNYMEFIDTTWRILSLQAVDNVRGDLYIHVISFVSGGVISYPPLFWVIVSFVYSYFYVSSAFKIYYWNKIDSKVFLFVLFFSLFLVQKSFEGINTVRTWTGLWILFFGVISYLQTKNYKYLILVFCPPLVHFGYFAMAVPIWLVLFLPTDEKIVKLTLVTALILSFFVQIDRSIILERTMQSELGAQRTESYYKEDISRHGEIILDVFNRHNFYKAMNTSGINKTIMIYILFIIILYGTYFKKFNYVESKLFSIGISTLVFSNITAFLYALSNRSSLIAFVFIFSSITLFLDRTYLDKYNNQFKKSQSILLLILGLCLSTLFLLKAAEIIQWMSAYFIGIPFIPILFEDSNMTIREFLGPVFEPLFN